MDEGLQDILETATKEIEEYIKRAQFVVSVDVKSLFKSKKTGKRINKRQRTKVKKLLEETAELVKLIQK